MMSDFQISLIVDFVICGGGSKIKFSLKGLTALEAERRFFLFAIQISGSGELKVRCQIGKGLSWGHYLLPFGARCKDLVLRGATALLRFPII